MLLGEKYRIYPRWSTKLNETTVVTVYVWDTTWKIWSTTTTVDSENCQTKFIVKQLSGPRKHAKFLFLVSRSNQDHGHMRYSSYPCPQQFTLLTRQRNTDKLDISVLITLTNPPESYDASVKSVGYRDVVLSIGDKRVGVKNWTWPVSEKLEKLAQKTVSCGDQEFNKKIDYILGANYQVKLYDVNCEDVITLIDNQYLVDVDITAEKCRRFIEIGRRYGIRHFSKKLEEVMEMDFWSNTDTMDGKIMCNEERVTVTSLKMRISKKYRVQSLPNKYTINAFDMKFDVYFYIQEYNNTSYLSIGVIIDKPTDNEYWSSLINLNIQLHHPENPEFNRSADISREFNNYQRSAGCPTFMLSNELSDYCQKDGSYIVTISISPTVINSDIEYPGIKDVMVRSRNKRIMVSRDLILNYCQYFKTSANTDKLSFDIFPMESLQILLDLIYHRSTTLSFNNIQKLLNISETIMCPYAYNYCDKLLATQYHNKVLSINRTKEFMDGWDLPELKEAEQMTKYVRRVHSPKKYSKKETLCDSDLPVNAIAVSPILN